MNTEHLLHIENLYKWYGDKRVLDNIDLKVHSGEFITVCGPSGCGKSTLLKIILGQEEPTDGIITLANKGIDRPNEQRGIVYQKYSLFEHLTVLENVLLGARLTTWPFTLLGSRKKKFTNEAKEFLLKVRLTEQDFNKYPYELSGGMKQRVAIAQALIKRPQILLMDEPFGALDPFTREELQTFILQLWEQTKMTIFFVTHDLEEAVFLGTRVIVLSQNYVDGRGKGSKINRGAKIVFDKALPRHALSTKAKESPELNTIVGEIKNAGFNPDSLRHVTEFNLSHPDSFQTLLPEEAKKS